MHHHCQNRGCCYISVQSHWENSSVAALHLLKFPWPALPFSVYLQSTSQHWDGSIQNDYYDILLALDGGNVCLNRSQSVFWFRYYRSSYSLPQTSVSLWHFWNSSSVVWILPHCWDSDCDCHWPELKTCGCLVSHRAQFLVLSSSFFILRLSVLWLKLILSPSSLLLMTHVSYSVLSSWSDTHQCLDHADRHLWRQDLDDTKQTETELRQDRCSPHEVKQNHFP